MMTDSAMNLTPEDIRETEIQQLVDLSRYIGSFQWQYNDPNMDQNLHDGPIAQELLKVPGLAGAVNEVNGVKTIDIKYVAMATLGYVAALARLVTGVPLEPVQKTMEDVGDL